MNADFRIDGQTIETERPILRPFRREDLEDFFAYASVEGVGERAGWKHHETLGESAKILDSFIEEDKTFAISLKETGRVVGSLGVEKYGMEERLSEFDGYRGRELGFVLSKDQWGRGLTTEAVNAVIAYLFGAYDLDFLICGHFDSNTQSRRVQEKCGFRPYRKLCMQNADGEKEPGTLNLLIRPDKHIRFVFSHPETLIWREPDDAGKDGNPQ